MEIKKLFRRPILVKQNGFIDPFVRIFLDFSGWLCQPLPIISGGSYKSEITPSSRVNRGIVINHNRYIGLAGYNRRELLYFARESLTFAALQKEIVPCVVVQCTPLHVNFRALRSNAEHCVEITVRRDYFERKISNVGNFERDRKW